MQFFTLTVLLSTAKTQFHEKFVDSFRSYRKFGKPSDEFNNKLILIQIPKNIYRFEAISG